MLPTEGSSVDLTFEGQVFKAQMKDGEIIVSGPEDNRIKGRFHGTANLDTNAFSVSQSGVASTALTLNGIEAVLSDTDGLVDNETLGSAGNFTLDGAMSTQAASSINSLICSLLGSTSFLWEQIFLISAR